MPRADRLGASAHPGHPMKSHHLLSALLVAILAACVLLIVLGTLVCWTFDPCPAGAAAADLPSFCPAQ